MCPSIYTVKLTERLVPVPLSRPRRAGYNVDLARSNPVLLIYDRPRRSKKLSVMASGRHESF